MDKDASALHVTARPEGVRLDILVSPRASREQVGPVKEGRLKVAVTAPPVSGEANAAVVALLARRLDLPRRAVSVVAGDRAKRKTVQVQGLGVEDICQRLGLSGAEEPRAPSPRRGQK